MNEEKQFLKPPEISPLLGVSLSRVYQLIATGVVPSVRIGGSLRIPRCAWERWLTAQSERALTSLRHAGPTDTAETENASVGRPNSGT